MHFLIQNSCFLIRNIIYIKRKCDQPRITGTCVPENPHAVNEVPLHDFKGRSQGLVIVYKIKGPMFFKNTCNSRPVTSYISTYNRVLSIFEAHTERWSLC